MLLPDLLPDIVFPPLARNNEDSTFSFEVKRAALGPYIIEHWGWDEELQKRLHAERFQKKPLFGIDCSGQRVGTLSLMLVDDYLRFGEFYLWPNQQRKGTGSRVLRHCIFLADQIGRSLRLEYLKWNPVGSLYERHGFKVIGDSATHWYMERKPQHHC